MSVTYENNSVKRIRMSTRWRVITLIFVLYTINCIDRISLSLAMPGITKDFAISPEVQGIILSSFFGHIAHSSFRAAIWLTGSVRNGFWE